MLVSFYCGCFRYDLGGGLFDDPPDCPGEGEIEVDEEEWAEGSVSHECPECKTVLFQGDDHFSPLERATPASGLQEAGVVQEENGCP